MEDEKCFRCANERGDILPLREDGRIILCEKHKDDIRLPFCTECEMMACRCKCGGCKNGYKQPRRND